MDKPVNGREISGLRAVSAGGLPLYVPGGKSGQQFGLCKKPRFFTNRSCGYQEAYPQEGVWRIVYDLVSLLL